MTLTWRDRSVGETSYRVEVKVGKNKFQEIQQLGAGSTSTVVSNLILGTTYTFRVRTEGPDGKFSPYAVVSFVLPH